MLFLCLFNIKVLINLFILIYFYSLLQGVHGEEVVDTKEEVGDNEEVMMMAMTKVAMTSEARTMREVTGVMPVTTRKKASMVREVITRREAPVATTKRR